jgi:hypothetical protein
VRRLVKPTTPIFALLLATLLQAAPASAHPWRHHVHLACADTAGYYSYRIGWWQTLAYGHVRPHWSVWCR